MIKEKYEELLAKTFSTNEPFFIKIDTPKKSNIFIGINENKMPFFMVEIDANEPDNLLALKETSGYMIRISNKHNRFKIIAKDKNSLDLFYLMIDNLITAVSNQDNVCNAIIQRLLLWEDFFSHTESGLINYKRRIGLIGELLFIEEELQKNNYDIINSWAGPLHEPKDFILNDTAIEIKTSIVSGNNRITISDENQLDDSGYSTLFLNVRLITQNQMNGRTIPEIIENIKFMIENNQSLLIEFSKKLLRSGYIEESQSNYKEKYELSNTSWYHVKDSENKQFPRIIPADLKKGIKFVKYKIELSELTNFLLDEKELEHALKELK